MNEDENGFWDIYWDTNENGERFENKRFIEWTDEQKSQRAAAEAARVAAGASREAALALAEKLSTATTLSQVRSFSKQIAQEYTDTRNGA